MSMVLLAIAHRVKRWALSAVVSALLIAMAGCALWKEYVGGYYYGLQAYIYGFPLVMMDVTKDVSTAVSTPGEYKAPLNQFAVMTHYPDASFRAVVRTGLDTLFAVAWADLDKEPLVLSVPNTNGRYYVIGFFDMWTNVFASIGKRTTGTAAASFLIVGPGWHGTSPADVSQTFRSRTRFVWVNGQMQADGMNDFAAVYALQKQYKLTPLSAWGKPYAAPSEVSVAPGTETGTSPLDQVRTMEAGAYFNRLAMAMKDNPPVAADASSVETLRKIGIVPGRKFDIDKVDPDVRKGLLKAMGAFRILEHGVEHAQTQHGWLVSRRNIGNYGRDYETRAGVALAGLGALDPPDVMYPTAFVDGDRKPFDGARKYVLHFDRGHAPPTNATWSLSLYDAQGFYVPNAIERYNLAPWMPLKYNLDGSLDLYIQASPPGVDKNANWLPAPLRGTFNLTVRNYWPKPGMLDGTYKIPPVRRK